MKNNTYGECLCSSVKFFITGHVPHFYQCHCSLCRKLSASASDTATFVDKSQFYWEKGVELISTYRLRSGYRSDFCSLCGSTVPHEMDNGKQFWVPAGLLDLVGNCKVKAHIFVSSKASWDDISSNAEQYETMPSVEALNSILNDD
ncbi:GFA family protein [Vibrio sp. NH-UV-68]|uniref:GFA family protein n=1 Tax=unclassified Vibrio TaxID=2614977 RepID=UPI0036F430F3